MTEFRCRLAGINIGVQALCPATRRFCRDYLTDETPVFSVSMAPEDIAREQEASDTTARSEGREPVLWPPAYLETLALYRKIAERMTEYNVLLFHASAIALDGTGYLFTAKSGTGKSTHARLWRETFGARAVMVNDDKPLLKFDGDSILICGTPWDGKHRLSANLSVPLNAVCLLSRGETNRIEPVSASEAFPFLLQQTYRPDTPEHTARTLSLVNRLSHSRVFRLFCNMDPDAARVSYEGMRG